MYLKRLGQLSDKEAWLKHCDRFGDGKNSWRD